MIRIEIPSTFELVNVVRMTILNAVESSGTLTGTRLDDLRLATSEAVTNAIQANLANDPGQRVEIRCELEPGLVKLQITDFGVGILSPEKLLPPLSDPSRLHTEGGFGLPLIRSLSRDGVEFTDNSPGTTVTIWMSQ